MGRIGKMTLFRVKHVYKCNDSTRKSQISQPSSMVPPLMILELKLSFKVK